MVCRTTSIGSAMTSFVKISDGLQEHQSLSLLHEIMREDPTAATPSRAELQAFINDIDAKVALSPNLTRARKRSLHERLEAARTAPLPGAVYYATRRIETRARRAKIALDDYYADTARSLGISVADVRNRLAASYEESKRERSLEAPAEWQHEFRSRPGRGALPMDRHTAYAMWRIDTEIANREAEADAVPVITHHHAVASPAVASVGYDPATGRLEVEMRSRQGHYYAFQHVPASVAENLTTGTNPGQVFNRQVRNNPDYAYPNATAAAEAAVQRRCASCGQFAGAGHACPPRGSAEEVALTAHRARVQRRVVRAQQAVASGTEAERVARYVAEGMDSGAAQSRVEAENAMAQMSPETTDRHRRNQRLLARIYPYRGGGGTFRVTALSTVRRILEEEPVVHAPVEAHITHTADENGHPVQLDHEGEVSGRVAITGGPTGGYVVNAVTEPGDTGEDRLQCTCYQYRTTYDCPHVRQLLGDMTRRINQRYLTDQHAIADDVAEVRQAAAVDHAASEAAQATAQQTWTGGGDGVSYSADMAAFQADYRAAKAKIAAGEVPVPYQTENATDGLGARDGGRGFGVEMEFCFPSEMSYPEKAAALSRIAEELYEAELTSSEYQDQYHAAAIGGYSDQHYRGWSFEEDGSVEGEIVSPIMYDEPQTWQNIDKVCEILRRNGAVADVRCGSHVHVSTREYDHTVDNHNRLLGMMAENEDTIYRLASNPERGTHRSAGHSGYANPNTAPSAGYQTVADAVRSNRGYRAINLEDTFTGSDRDHAEFRVWDGTLQPAVIQSQIKMSLAMTDAAFRDTDYTPGGHQPFGSTRRSNRENHGAQRRLTGEDWQADTAGVRAFADRLFRRREDKAQMAAMFAWTRWQRHGR